AGAGKTGEIFGAFVSNPTEVILYQGIFMLVTAIVVLFGIKGGIERSCKIMMPMLFVAMLILILRAVTLPGAMAGIEFYLQPDFSKVTSETWLAALGQGFFSLSLGAGAIMIYGSYLPRTGNIISSVKQICFI
ncbi:sodium-dependent transporter, partial [Cloacibacillus evryensis]|nr:sodium-dependent transporter [Cloacibacillus evryensis]